MRQVHFSSIIAISLVVHRLEASTSKPQTLMSPSSNAVSCAGRIIEKLTIS